MLSARLQASFDKLRKQREVYALLPSIGERINIDGTDCIVHIPEGNQKNLPLFIELHGGAWVGGDAVMVDSLCHSISHKTPCVAVNINYKKLDIHPFPYPMEEVITVINHLCSNADKYGIDPHKVVVCGQSAGAHIAAGAAVIAKSRGISLARQILVYPFLDFTGVYYNPLPKGKTKEEAEQINRLYFGNLDMAEVFLSPAVASEKDLEGIAPADIILCTKDELRPHGFAYYEKLRRTGISVTLKEYANAVHGFLEINRDDYIAAGDAKSLEQAIYTEDCENYIIDIMKRI